MISNPCIRCGKERIVVKTWKEHIDVYFGNSTVVYTESACPDKACQKLVDKELAVARTKRDTMKKDKEQRANENKTKRFKKTLLKRTPRLLAI